MSKCCSLLFGIALVLVLAQTTLARTWTARNGNTIQAVFVRVNGSKVVLKRGNQVLQYSLTSLSSQDREWIKSKQEVRRLQRWVKTDGDDVRGTFVRMEDETVIIRSAGKLVKIAWDELEEENQTWLIDILTGLERETELPQDAKRATDDGEENDEEDPSGFASSSVSSPFLPEHEESWENLEGKKIQAVFIKVEDGKVYLRKDGKVVKVALSKLSTRSRMMAEHRQRVADMLARAERRRNDPGNAGMGRGDSDRDENNRLADSGRRTSGINRPSRPSRSTSGRGRGSVGGFGTPGGPGISGIHGVEPPRPRRAALPSGIPGSNDMRRGEAERNIGPRTVRTPGRPRPSAGNRHFPEPTPTIPTSPRHYASPNFQQGEMAGQYQCLKCKRTFTGNYEVGDKCPHCGITFDYMEEDGKVVDVSKTGIARYGFGIIKVVVGIGFVIAILARLFTRR